MADTAVGYIRVSKEQQAESGVSLDVQRERIIAYATAQGLELLDTIADDVVSGGTPLDARTGGQRLLDTIHRHKVGHVVALKLDRLFRDAGDALATTKRWDKAGVALHLVDVGGQAINTSSAMGRMFLTMMAGFAELERSLIAERTAAALAHKKAQGQVYSAMPLGYQGVDGRLVPVDDELRVVREVITMRESGLSFWKIAGQMNERGIVGKRGGRFYASTVRAICGNDLHNGVT